MKTSSIVILIMTIVIFSLIGLNYYQYDNNTKIIKIKDDKIESIGEEKNTKQTEIDRLTGDLNKEREKYKDSLSKIIEHSIIKILYYSTPTLEVGIEKLNNRDILIFANQIRAALLNINENQYVLVEANTDDLKFLGDIDNNKNINLAFKRIIKNILELNEEEINNLQFRVNTMNNNRDIKIYTVTFK